MFTIHFFLKDFNAKEFVISSENYSRFLNFNTLIEYFSNKFMNSTEEESLESTENEDAEPKSNIILNNEINQYDILLKDNETYKQRMKEFHDLQSDIINWLSNENNHQSDHFPVKKDDENNFPKIKSISEVELSTFSVDIRPYHNDAITSIHNCV